MAYRIFKPPNLIHVGKSAKDYRGCYTDYFRSEEYPWLELRVHTYRVSIRSSWSTQSQFIFRTPNYGEWWPHPWPKTWDDIQRITRGENPIAYTGTISALQRRNFIRALRAVSPVVQLSQLESRHNLNLRPLRKAIRLGNRKDKS